MKIDLKHYLSIYLSIHPSILLCPGKNKASNIESCWSLIPQFPCVLSLFFLPHPSPPGAQGTCSEWYLHPSLLTLCASFSSMILRSANSDPAS